MKILVISSSPRRERSLTLLLAKEVLKGAVSNRNIDSEIVQLCDLKIDFCRHCEACHKNILSCPVKDDVFLILKKMLEADGIVLSSPNYINQVTASMKALFDRSSHFIHCKRITGKYIAGVVTSGSGQDKDILDYLEYYAHICGAQYSGGVSSRAPISKEKMEEAFILGNKLASDIEERKIYPDQIEIIEKFKKHIQKIMQTRRGEWEEEYEYWQNKGWL